MQLSRIFSAAALAALIAVPFVASAQTAPVAPVPGVHARHGHHGYMHALRALNLTTDQKSQIAAFRKDTKAANLNADPATKKANGQKLRSEVEGVLTPDQRTQLTNEIKAEHVAPAPTAK